MNRSDRLIRMANDIGSFFRAQPHREDAIAGIANHLRSYWTPHMRAKLARQVDDGVEGLDDLPREALVKLSANPDAKPTQPPGGDAG